MLLMPTLLLHASNLALIPSHSVKFKRSTGLKDSWESTLREKCPNMSKFFLVRIFLHSD